MDVCKLNEILDALIAGLEHEVAPNFSLEKAVNDETFKKLQHITDLIESKYASYQALISEQERINQILLNMAEGFVLLDQNKEILLCNQSVRNFFDYEEEVVGLNIFELINDKSIIYAVDRALVKEQSSMFELWIHDDLILNAYVSPTQKMSSHENRSAVTIFFVNVTKDKLLEKQKRIFFSNASHELKTPITSILGFSEMINNNIITTEEQKSDVLKRIEIEARRMSELINNLLMISNLESKTKVIESEDFNFKDVLQEAIASVSPINNNQTIGIDLNGVDVIVYANRRRLYEMCVNLIENAVKYNKPNGHVSIDLKAKKYYLTLKVKDTGIGIPPEHQARVFERFFRVDYGRDKKVGGSGLGLSIVKHIVNLYNGEISLRSKKGVGTTIQVRLPIVRRFDK